MRDLRVEVEREGEAEASEPWWSSWKLGWRTQALAGVDVALCEYAEKVTQTPHKLCEADIAALRSVGLEDGAIHDAIQVIAYFNYINRIADAVHVDLEADMDPYPEG